MSSLVILFIAIIAAVVPFNKVVDSASSPAIDINKILELVQQQQQNTGIKKQRRLQLRQDSSDSDSDDYLSDLDTSYDSDNNRYARLRKEKIINLIEKVANEKGNKVQNDERITYRKVKPNYGLNNFVRLNEKFDNSQSNKNIETQILEQLLSKGMNKERKTKTRGDYSQSNKNVETQILEQLFSKDMDEERIAKPRVDNSQSNRNIETQILEQLLSKGINDEERKTKSRGDVQKKRLKPNRLLGTKNDIKEYSRNDGAPGLEDYSKVYIVLNPQAVRKSKNNNSLNDLVSKVLALSSPTSKRDRQGKRKPRRYKGFVVNEDRLSRRSRRESKEMYAPRDSLADDYNTQKRSRISGGGTGGRTAIPYIRHRGDIYERDN